MRTLSSQVFQAIVGNGYEVRLDRSAPSDGTSVWVIDPGRSHETFYYFNADDECRIVRRLAVQYCTNGQIDAIYADQEPALVLGEAAGFVAERYRQLVSTVGESLAPLDRSIA